MPNFYHDHENKVFLEFDLIQPAVCKKCKSENHDDNAQNAGMKTVMFIYHTSACNYCPKFKFKCKLRRDLAKFERKYHIGYKKIDKNTLLIPRTANNEKKRKYIDVRQHQINVCHDCLRRLNEHKK